MENVIHRLEPLALDVPQLFSLEALEELVQHVEQHQLCLELSRRLTKRSLQRK